MDSSLIPAVDGAGLPGPAWIFHVLLVFTFFLHMLFMNLALGGTLLAALAHLLSGGRCDDFRGVLANRLVAVNNYGISMAITTGIAPLLFIQVLYHHFFYPATIIIGGTWFSLVVLLMVGYYSVYLYKFRGAPARGQGGTLWILLAAVMFTIIAMIQVVVQLIHAQPQLWPAIADSPWALVGDATLIPRFLHFVLGAVAFSAIVIAWWSARQLRQGHDVESNTAIAAFTWKWALWCTALQIVDGFVLLLLLPREVLLAFMRGGAATTLPLGLAILLAIGALMMLARASDPGQRPGLVSGVLVTMVGTIAVMSITRHQVRSLYLEPYSSQSAWLEVPQWGNFVLFAVLLVAGLGLVAYMLKRVLGSPATGDEAA
jgi:hypothetical protein